MKSCARKVSTKVVLVHGRSCETLGNVMRDILIPLIMVGVVLAAMIGPLAWYIGCRRANKAGHPVGIRIGIIGVSGFVLLLMLSASVWYVGIGVPASNGTALFDAVLFGSNIGFILFTVFGIRYLWKHADGEDENA